MTKTEPTAKGKFALWVLEKIAVTDGEALRPPSSDLVWTHLELDGRRLTVVPRGDAFDLYYGRKAPVVLSVTPKAALRLAWFILWRWWVLGTVLGLKLRVWYWALSVIIRGAT